jgi:transcription elongation factor GreB
MRSSLTRLSRKGRALLLKKSVGDEVSLQKPDGSEAWYQVLKVEYQAYDTGL